MNNKPEQIEMMIGILIRVYMHDQNAMTAKNVENQINALLSCPDYIVDSEQRCLFRRLAAHWRCLAWIHRDQSDDIGTNRAMEVRMR